MTSASTTTARTRTTAATAAASSSHFLLEDNPQDLGRWDWDNTITIDNVNYFNHTDIPLLVWDLLLHEFS